MGADGHAIVVGTLGGGLLVYDLRFLAPWKQWKVSSGASVLSLRSANFGPSPGVFAALGGDANEVALFDMARGSCSTLFLTEPVADKQKEAAVSVPTLLQARTRGPTALGTHDPGPERFNVGIPGARRAAGCVRALWLPPRGAQTFLLAGGADRKVRRWSLDPEHHAAETYIVTPHDHVGHPDGVREKMAYGSNHLGDVFVVQEQVVSRADGPSFGASRAGAGSGDPDGDGRPRGPNPNHRDAILDMCAISLQHEILVTAGRDGLVKLWK